MAECHLGGWLLQSVIVMEGLWKWILRSGLFTIKIMNIFITLKNKHNNKK